VAISIQTLLKHLFDHNHLLNAGFLLTY